MRTRRWMTTSGHHLHLFPCTLFLSLSAVRQRVAALHVLHLQSADSNVRVLLGKGEEDYKELLTSCQKPDAKHYQGHADSTTAFKCAVYRCEDR